MLNTAAGSQIVPLPDGLVKDWQGLPGFIKITVTDHDGNVVATRQVTLCPDTYDQQRLTPNGPADPTYPQYCSANAFTLGMVWGIDDGWAVNPVTSSPSYPHARLADGLYTVQVAISPTYAALFGIAPADAQVTVNATVKEGSDGGCPPVCPLADGRHAQTPGPAQVPITTNPDPSTEPDLVALPAWGITTENQGGRDYLDFGATVWNRGPAPMVVEGFRRPGHGGHERLGELLRPRRHGRGTRPRGHAEVRRPPRPPALALPAVRHVPAPRREPDRHRLQRQGGVLPRPHGRHRSRPAPRRVEPGTARFRRDGLRIGDLPVDARDAAGGWGDTYFQGLPGQSFDITDLPNGTYFIAVKANPTGELYERSAANNVRYRRVILGGAPGARTVTVPPWNGIDTEGDGGGIIAP